MTAPEAQRVIGRYQLGQIQMLQPLGNAGGFSGARFWQVASDQGTFCLRRWPSNSQVDVTGIHQVLVRAQQAELPVAAPILNRDGLSVTRDALGFEWELSRWVEGTADFNQNPSSERLVDAVQTLARFHRATSDRKWNARSDALQTRLTMLTDTPRQLPRLQAALGAESDGLAVVGRELLPDLERAIEPLRKSISCFVNQDWPMVHAIRDIHHDHLFFHDERLSGIVDFGAMRIEARCFDLARMVGSLQWNGEHPWDESLRIYSETDTILDSERELIHSLHKCNVLLGIVNWLNWIYLEQRKFDNWDAVKIRFNWLVNEFAG